MTLQLRIASHSEIGPVRKNNQDSGYASAHLLVVADGMGGAAAGDLASAVAVDTIRHVDAAGSGTQMLEVLARAMQQANDRIADLVEADYALEGMGTTVTGALFDGSQFGLAHIGDSRAYLLHESRLERLTHDHSWVQSLVDDGKISEAEAAVHPHRSLLLKVLNGHPNNEPDLTMVTVVPGDRLLLCSDGLCGLVDDPVIERAMRLPGLDDALRQLVDEALAEGGVDNITVILADVVEEVSDPAASVLGAAAELRLPPSRFDPPAPAAAHTTAAAGLAQPEGDEPRDLDDDEQRQASEDTVVTTRISDVRGGSSAVTAGAGAATGTAAAAPRDEEDEERYRPQPPGRRRLGRPLIGLLVLILVLGAGLGSAYAWTRTQYFVGAADDKVAIFRGLSDSIPGVSLSTLYEVQPLAVSSLPPYYQERVRSNIDVSGLPAARLTVTQLIDAARRCALGLPAAPTASALPSPSVGVTSSPSSRLATTSTSTVTPRPPASPRPSVRPSTRTPAPRPSAAASASARPQPGC